MRKTLFLFRGALSVFCCLFIALPATKAWALIENRQQARAELQSRIHEYQQTLKTHPDDFKTRAMLARELEALGKVTDSATQAKTHTREAVDIAFVGFKTLAAETGTRSSSEVWKRTVTALGMTVRSLLALDVSDPDDLHLAEKVLAELRAAPKHLAPSCNLARGNVASSLALLTPDLQKRTLYFAEAKEAWRHAGATPLLAESLAWEAIMLPDKKQKRDYYAEADQILVLREKYASGETVRRSLKRQILALRLFQAYDSENVDSRKLLLDEAARLNEEANCSLADKDDTRWYSCRFTEAEMAAIRGETSTCIQLLKEMLKVDPPLKEKIGISLLRRPTFERLRQNEEFTSFLLTLTPN